MHATQIEQLYPFGRRWINRWCRHIEQAHTAGNVSRCKVHITDMVSTL
jgi:hypothetical protein